MILDSSSLVSLFNCILKKVFQLDHYYKMSVIYICCMNMQSNSLASANRLKQEQKKRDMAAAMLQASPKEQAETSLPGAGHISCSLLHGTSLKVKRHLAGFKGQGTLITSSTSCEYVFLHPECSSASSLIVIHTVTENILLFGGAEMYSRKYKINANFASKDIYTVLLHSSYFFQVKVCCVKFIACRIITL